MFRENDIHSQNLVSLLARRRVLQSCALGFGGLALGAMGQEVDTRTNPLAP